jgi:hypothetical protein
MDVPHTAGVMRASFLDEEGGLSSGRSPLVVAARLLLPYRSLYTLVYRPSSSPSPLPFAQSTNSPSPFHLSV